MQADAEAGEFRPARYWQAPPTEAARHPPRDRLLARRARCAQRRQGREATPPARSFRMKSGKLAPYSIRIGERRRLRENERARHRSEKFVADDAADRRISGGQRLRQANGDVVAVDGEPRGRSAVPSGPSRPGGEAPALRIAVAKSRWRSASGGTLLALRKPRQKHRLGTLCLSLKLRPGRDVAVPFDQRRRRTKSADRVLEEAARRAHPLRDHAYR